MKKRQWIAALHRMRGRRSSWLEVAKALCVTERTISGWRSGKVTPSELTQAGIIAREKEDERG